MASENVRRNSLFAFLAKVGGAGASLLTTMVLARLLSSEAFAAFVMAYTVVMLGGLLGGMGMGNAVLRYAGHFLGQQRRWSARDVTRRCVRIGHVSLGVVAVMLLLCAGLFDRYLASWPAGLVNGLLIAAWLWANGLLVLTTSAIRAYGQVSLGASAEIAVPRCAIAMGTVLLFLFQVQSLTLVLAVMAGVNLVVAAWSSFILAQAVQAGDEDAEQTVETVPLHRIYDCALPIMVSTLLFQGMTDLTLFLVGIYCQPQEIALYAASYRVWSVFGLPQSAVASAIQGRIAEVASQENKWGLESLVRTAANLAMCPTVAGAIIVYFFAGFLMSTLFGESFAAAAPLLKILCLFQCLSVALGPSEHLLAMSGRQRAVLLASLGAAPVFDDGRMVAGLDPRHDWRGVGDRTGDTRLQADRDLRHDAIDADSAMDRAAIASGEAGGRKLPRDCSPRVIRMNGLRDTPTSPQADADAAATLLSCALAAVILTQRLAIPLGAFQLPVAVPAVLACVGWGLWRGRLLLGRTRLLAYGVAIGTLLFASLVASRRDDGAITSIAYLCGLFSVMVAIQPSGDVLPLFRFHQRLVLVFAVVGFLQFAVQLVGIPFLDPITRLPQSLQLDGYNTTQPLFYGANLIKPNGMIFLEASLLSKSLAIALLIEFFYFRRLPYVAVYCLCYACTFSGTGAITLAVGVLFGMRLIPRQTLVAFGVLCGLAVLTLAATRYGEVWVNRVSEFGKNNSSARTRFIEPYTRIVEVFETDLPFFGHGAGSVEESFTRMGGVDAFDPTAVKLTYEYGLVPACLFMAFLLYCIYSSSAPLALKHANVVVLIFLSGGLLEAATLYYVFLLSGVIVPPAVVGSSARELPRVDPLRLAPDRLATE